MAKKLNKPAQAARDAFIQRKVDEETLFWKFELLAVQSHRNEIGRDLRRCREYLACTAIAFVIALCFAIALGRSDSSRTPVSITPPINTPIVAYTENGWHQAYVDISGNIRSMDTGMKILNATSWMKP